MVVDVPRHNAKAYGERDAWQNQYVAALGFSDSVQKKHAAGVFAQVYADIDGMVCGIFTYQYEQEGNRIRHDTGNPETGLDLELLIFPEHEQGCQGPCYKQQRDHSQSRNIKIEHVQPPA